MIWCMLVCLFVLFLLTLPIFYYIDFIYVSFRFLLGCSFYWWTNRIFNQWINTLFVYLYASISSVMFFSIWFWCNKRDYWRKKKFLCSLLVPEDVVISIYTNSTFFSFFSIFLRIFSVFTFFDISYRHRFSKVKIFVFT